MPERNEERRMYRRNRRGRKRYRKPRFDNRKKDKGWLAPSIQHKLDSHIRLLDFLRSILPITRVIIEVASFDLQKIQNPDISGKEYQQGEQKGFSNLREYIIHRDGHECQNPNCKNRSKTPVLVVHHIDFNRTNNHPSNLITLCNKCHTPANHSGRRCNEALQSHREGFLKEWKPKIKPFKGVAFMNAVRWKITEKLNAYHTYGYITKDVRREFGIEKSHANDAFVIASGTTQARCTQYQVKQRRRNNRSLEMFYDAVYIDSRDGKRKKGKELFSGRTTRNKNGISENLRKYHQQKVKKGYRSIRKARPLFRRDDVVCYDGEVYRVKGAHCKNTRVILQENNKSVSIKKVEIVKYRMKPDDFVLRQPGFAGTNSCTNSSQA